LKRQVSKGQFIGLSIVFLWFFIGGMAHFVATDTEVSIVPTYIPWPLAAVLVSGFFELLGAQGRRWRLVLADIGGDACAYLYVAKV